MPIKQNERSQLLKMLFKRVRTALNEEDFDEETTRMVERMAVLRISTKHITLWIHQLGMKRREMCELAELMGFDEVEKEIANEKSMERWAKRCTTHFTKKVKRMLFEEIDNIVWSGDEEITRWCAQNKVYDEITEDEIEEIWKREGSDDDEPVRLNGKYVWEAAKSVCEFISSHHDLIHITTFGEYRVVMLKVMRVIKEAQFREKTAADLEKEKDRRDNGENTKDQSVDLHRKEWRNDQRRDQEKA